MKRMYIKEKGEFGIGTLILFIAMIIVAAVAATVIIQTAYVLQQQAEETGNIARQDVSTGFKIITIQGIREDIIYTETVGTGDGSTTSFTKVLSHKPVNPGSITITNSAGEIVLRDNGVGELVLLIGSGVSGWIGYDNGTVHLNFTTAPRDGDEINITYGSGYGGTISYLDIKVGLMAGSPPISLDSVLIEISDGYNDETLTYNASATNFSDLDGSHFGVKIARDMPPCNWERDRVITAGDIIRIYVNTTAVGLYLQPQTHVMVKLIPKHGVPNLVEFTTPSTYTTKYMELW
ncbi:MAG: flagellin [Thermoplasmata archaeon]|nr:flagellin [Thermoplasmata archaeon]